MTGIIEHKGEKYLVSNEHGHTPKWWAWKIEQDIGTKIPMLKWERLPKRCVL